jgi:glucose-1-phosphatase
MKKAIIFDFFGVVLRDDVVDEALVTYIQEQQEKGARTFLLSNANEVLVKKKILVHAFVSEIFDAFYYSGKTGFSKPDIRAYELILKEHSLKPEECVYFDDNEKNVAAAGSLGIKSYLFESTEQVRETCRF